MVLLISFLIIMEKLKLIHIILYLEEGGFATQTKFLNWED